MSTWLIRLNGMPLMEITAPYHLSPTALARDVLLRGATDSPEVTWRWLP